MHSARHSSSFPARLSTGSVPCRSAVKLLQAATDFVGTVRDWRIEVGELIERKSDGVMAFLRVVARGKGSGAPVYQPVFSAVTVRNGRIARIEDHTERSEALEAAGLSE